MGIEENMELAPTPSSEDVVQALLDYFVEPVLPPKRFHESPSLDQQLSVARQRNKSEWRGAEVSVTAIVEVFLVIEKVRAVVILYNYYQRKLQPQLEFLDLTSFCKLVVVLKPALLPFMKLMHHSDFSQLTDLKNHLSPIEKAIMDACDLCGIMGALNYFKGIERWPIAKVAILVIDSSMENCLLLRSTATQGVWSLIEKDLAVSNISSQGTLEAEYINRKSGAFNQTPAYNQSIIASALQQLALSAVMEVAGTDQKNMKVLESHVIYPFNEEAATTCFYVMQCTQSIGEGFQVPIEDIVNRFQEPLLKLTLNGWMVNPVVEYFQLFPYAGIFSELLSRTMLVKRSDVNQANYSPLRVDALNHGEINSSPLHGSQNHKDKNQSLENLVKVNQQTNACPAESRKGVSTAVIMDTSTAIKTAGDKQNDEKAAGICNQGPTSPPVYGTPVADPEIFPCEMNSEDVKVLQNLLTRKGSAISETAHRILSQKVDKMRHQQRILEDKIALCSRDIQKIIDGNEDALALRMGAIVDFYEGETEIQGETHQQCEVQRTIQCSRRNKLTGDVLTFKCPCQELDYICHARNWRLPRYSVSTSPGGFFANVTVKETDFEFSCKGSLLSTPSAARDSAAALMIAKMGEMASQT